MDEAFTKDMSSIDFRKWKSGRTTPVSRDQKPFPVSTVDKKINEVSEQGTPISTLDPMTKDHYIDRVMRQVNLKESLDTPENREVIHFNSLPNQPIIDQLQNPAGAERLGNERYQEYLRNKMFLNDPRTNEENRENLKKSMRDIEKDLVNLGKFYKA